MHGLPYELDSPYCSDSSDRATSIFEGRELEIIRDSELLPLEIDCRESYGGLLANYFLFNLLLYDWIKFELRSFPFLPLDEYCAKLCRKRAGNVLRVSIQRSLDRYWHRATNDYAIYAFWWIL